MTRRPGSRLLLASAISLGAALIAVLAPWDARASSPGADGQAAVHSRSTSVLATHPAEAPLVTLSEAQIPITYHSQQDGDWCDPTDIEMWLQADGVPLHGLDDYAIQQGFWNYELANNDGYPLSQWTASPYAVAVPLDRFGGWDDIGDDPQPTADAAGVVISYSLDMLLQPVIVMVGQGTHYVLVTGVTLSAAGTDAPPLSVTVNDPLAYGVGGTPPAGSNGTETMSWDDFPVWYTPNVNHGGIWAGQCVLIAAGIPLFG